MQRDPPFTHELFYHVLVQDIDRYLAGGQVRKRLRCLKVVFTSSGVQDPNESKKGVSPVLLAAQVSRACACLDHCADGGAGSSC